MISKSAAKLLTLRNISKSKSHFLFFQHKFAGFSLNYRHREGLKHRNPNHQNYENSAFTGLLFILIEFLSFCTGRSAGAFFLAKQNNAAGKGAHHDRPQPLCGRRHHLAASLHRRWPHHEARPFQPFPLRRTFEPNRQPRLSRKAPHAART